MKRILILVPFLLGLMALAACQTEPDVVYVTVEREVVETEQITATPEPSTAVDTSTDPTATPEPQPTKTLAPAIATQQALLAMVPTRAPAEPGTAAIAPDDYVGLVNQACTIVEENYVRDNFNGVDWTAVCDDYRTRAESVTSEEELFDLLTALIRELSDDHSRFVPPGQMAAEFNLPTDATGRPWPGMQVWPAKEDDELRIWYVCRSGPAASAGLQRGDVILAVNGTEVPRSEDGELDLSLYNEIVYSGADGLGDATSAVFTVLQGPDSTPRDIEIQFGGASGCDGWGYDLISTEPRIGYIRVPNFGGDSDENIQTAIELLEEDAPLDGLILDIRHNPGGNSDADIAIFTEGEFGKVGSIRSDSTQTIYRIRGPVKWSEETPLVVLTDGNSHSAADYFAAAMKVSGRATLVGMPTAGNTEGISGFSLGNGSLIRLAISTIQLPDGSFIEGVGVEPDVVVPLGDWGLREQPDVQLQAGVQTLLEQIN